MNSDLVYMVCVNLNLRVKYIGSTLGGCISKLNYCKDLDVVVSENSIAVRKGKFLFGREFDEDSDLNDVLRDVHIYRDLF